MNLFIFAAIFLFLLMTAAFMVAMLVKDNSIVDVVYGTAFVMAGWATFAVHAQGHPRQYLLLGLVSVWGIRLATHIFMRKRGEEGEDFRYRQWRQEWGNTFVWRSYLQIFMLQGAVVYLVLMPLLLVIHAPGAALGLLDGLGVLIWVLGLAFEAVGDWQLLQFKKDPANKGHVIQSGLWRYTRHPNYFGEATLWWGVFLVALDTPLGMWAVASPLVIDFLLLKVSGIPMLEAKYAGNVEFEAYKRRTNAFFPWFPGRAEGGTDER